jgi:hypothetical protein
VLLVLPLVNTSTTTVTLKNFKAVRDIKFPAGATHATLAAALGIFNFKTKKAQLFTCEPETIGKNEKE